MATIYTSQNVAITITVTIDGGDLASAASAVIAYKTPNGTTGQWTATLGATTVSYAASPSDITIGGTWKLQPVITFGDGSVIPGATVDMIVANRFA